MTRSLSFLVGFTAIITVPALAQESVPRYGFRTAYDLAQTCAQPVSVEAITADEQARLQLCGAYIQGFLGLYGADRQDNNDTMFCLPAEGVSPDRVRRLFLLAMERRPQISDLPANLTLTATLTAAYRCNGATAQATSLTQ